MKTISVVINARLKSSRLPRKLLRPFGGTTLIEIALEKINKMDFFKHRYLAAAEDELQQFVSKHQNVELLKRTPESVLPGYGDHKVIYAHYEKIDSDYIFWLNPCHPLLSIETVEKAYQIFIESDFNSYTSVVQTSEWLFDKKGNPITNKDGTMLSTAHSNKFFKATHSFHIFNKGFFLENYQVWTKTKNDPHLIEITEEENFDADTPVQFETAEAVFSKRHGVHTS
jgi:spore coat polysaccharide biosynthesis protein SpsF